MCAACNSQRAMWSVAQLARIAKQDGGTERSDL